jgi:pyridoxal biosynthesis lyase PdxS
MIRLKYKGEAGTGDAPRRTSQAHPYHYRGNPRPALPTDSAMTMVVAAKVLQAPLRTALEIARAGKLPVVLLPLPVAFHSPADFDDDAARRRRSLRGSSLRRQS